MDERYKNINSVVDEILGIFCVVVPIFIVGCAIFFFKDEILTELFNMYSKF